MMKRVNLIIGTIIIMMSMQGCIDLGIYISDVPLGPPGSSNPVPGLEGRWEKLSESKDTNGFGTLEFIMFNGNEYLVRSGEGSDRSLARAFNTKIDGSTFLNIQDLSETEKKFVFCKYYISEEKILNLRFVGDTLFKTQGPLTSKKLRKFIKKHLDSPELWNNELNITLKKTAD